MKKIISLLLLVTAAVSLPAKNQTAQQGQPMWNPPKAACAAYNAEVKASQSATVKVTGNAFGSSEARETRFRDAVMPIVCNPPVRNQPAKKPAKRN